MAGLSLLGHFFVLKLFGVKLIMILLLSQSILPYIVTVVIPCNTCNIRTVGIDETRYAFSLIGRVLVGLMLYV